MTNVPGALPAVLHPDAVDSAAVRAAAAPWGSGATPEGVRTGATFVYRVRYPAGRLFLRLTAPGWRSREEVELELAFVLVAREGGVRVAAPVASIAGDLVEEVEGPRGTLLAAAFAEAPGTPVARADLTAMHAEALGRTIGRLHHVSERLTLDLSARGGWGDEVAVLRAWLPDGDPALDVVDELEREMAALPTTRGEYGLIHFDAGPSNLLWEGGLPTLIDFDDCCSLWYAADIANAAWAWRRSDARAAAVRVFLDGYGEARDLPADLERLLPLFIRLRAASVLAWYLFSRFEGATEHAEREAEARALLATPGRWL